MFSLTVMVCVAGFGCADLRSPIDYPSEERCRIAGAILAGRYAAKAVRVTRHRYVVECVEVVADRD